MQTIIRNRIPYWLEMIYGKKSKLLKVLPLVPEASSRHYYRIKVYHSEQTSSKTKQEKSLILCVENINRQSSIVATADYIIFTQFLRLQGLFVPELHLYAELVSNHHNSRQHQFKWFEVCKQQLYKNDRTLPMYMNQNSSYQTFKVLLLQSDAGQEDLATVFYRALNIYHDRILAQKLYLDALHLAWKLSQIATLPKQIGSRKFDAEKFDFELEFLQKAIMKMRESLQSKHSQVCFTETENWISDAFYVLAKCNKKLLATQEELVFVHRDFHSRNILLSHDVLEASHYNMQLIDYQDARYGLRYYDWASLVYDPYLALDKEFRHLGIQYFQSMIRDYGLCPFDSTIFFLQALQRLFKALGTYIFQVYSKNHLKYMNSITHCITLIEEVLFVDSLHPKFSPQRPILNDADLSTLKIFLDRLKYYLKKSS